MGAGHIHITLAIEVNALNMTKQLQEKISRFTVECNKSDILEGYLQIYQGFVITCIYTALGCQPPAPETGVTVTLT